ncbi:hypothetical protein MJH12_06500, partial [bacterium]|nr:hypothetical protein [bacterium]
MMFLKHSYLWIFLILQNTIFCNIYSDFLPDVLQSFGQSRQIQIQSNQDLKFLAQELTAKKKYHSSLHAYTALNRRLNGKYDLDIINLLKRLKYKDLHLIYLYKTQTYLKTAAKPKRKFLEFIAYLESYYTGYSQEFEQKFPDLKNQYIQDYQLLNDQPSEFIKILGLRSM